MLLSKVKVKMRIIKMIDSANVNQTKHPDKVPYRTRIYLIDAKIRRTYDYIDGFVYENESLVEFLCPKAGLRILVQR